MNHGVTRITAGHEPRHEYTTCDVESLPYAAQKIVPLALFTQECLYRPTERRKILNVRNVADAVQDP